MPMNAIAKTVPIVAFRMAICFAPLYRRSSEILINVTVYINNTNTRRETCEETEKSECALRNPL
jgi:hypothetical protein